MNALVTWFTREKGWLDKDCMGLADIPGQGRGAVALQDIPEGHALFTIPRSLTLSTRTSELPRFIGDASWKSLQFDRGWAGLILCMIWEESRGIESKWSGYLETLPTTFDTPMFWTENDLRELEGTAVLEKIGKDEAEKDFHEKLVPIVLSRPDLFNPAHLLTYYSLENYHRMGSRILSRSFHVERWQGEDGEEVNHEQPPHGTEVREGGDDSISVDGNDQTTLDGPNSEEDSENDEDEDDPSDVAMVPMADMLNARYGSGNAKLFYEPTELKMVTTKPIKAGEQIYNTYGDPPNSELLRRYGHVDLVPLPDNPSREGNPADVAEVRADLLVRVVCTTCEDVSDEALRERIDWWLEEGGDDVFVIGTDLDLPDTLISFLKLLLLSPSDWERARARNKPPKPKLDDDAKFQTLPLIFKLIEKRLAQYPTSLEHDEALLTSSSILSTNLRNALIVRIGEKRILAGCAKRFGSMFEEAKSASPNDGRADPGRVMGHKKRKRVKGDVDAEDGNPRRKSSC